MDEIIKMNSTDNIVIEYEKIKAELIEQYNRKSVAEDMIKSNEADIKKINEELASFTIMQKLFKRGEYLSKKEELEHKLAFISKRYEENSSELAQANVEIERLKKRISEIEPIAQESKNNKEEEVSRKIKGQIVYENGIPTINDSQVEGLNDCIDCQFNEATFSFDDIALVHATNYFPFDGKIKSAQDAKVVYEYEMNINGEKKKVSSYSHRDSVHFALNGKVSSHAYGNWDDRKFIIIDAMKYHLDAINAISPEDTWTHGSVELSPEAIILVNEKEYDKLDKEISGKFRIVKFSGDSKVCVDKMLLLLGYKPQNVGKDSWTKQDEKFACVNAQILEKEVLKQCPEKRASKHFYSSEMTASNILPVRDGILTFLRGETVDTKEGSKITQDEMLALFQYFSKANSDLMDPRIPQYLDETHFFVKFLKDYGIRYSNGEYYLLDDKSIVTSYEQEIDMGTLNQIYQAFKDCQKSKEVISDLSDEKGIIK